MLLGQLLRIEKVKATGFSPAALLLSAIAYKEVTLLLKKDYSIRNIAKLTGYSVQTVQTVKNLFINKKQTD